MATTTMTIRMDTEIKQSLEQLCEEMGMPISTAFNICAREMIRRWGMPFAVKGDIFNEETAQSMRDTLAGKNLSKAYDNLDEMWSDIFAER